MKLIDLVTGTRPNFMKVAPLINALQNNLNKGGNIGYRLIHTGQHADRGMSEVFWEDLNISRPDINLNVGYCSSLEDHEHSITLAYEKELIKQRPDMVVVVGDCTSTLACAKAVKNIDKDILLSHVEAGLRCGDHTMPEEYNRIKTDELSDYLFTTSTFANTNLLKQNIDPDKIFLVGNTMIDTLMDNIHRLKQPVILKDLGLVENYFVLTLHRRSNILSPAIGKSIISSVMKAADGRPVIFPIHPHTAKKLNIEELNFPNLHVVNPMSYLEFIFLVKNAKCVISDSGGISEETTILNVPCITLRDHTERPETCIYGSNVLVGTLEKNILNAFQRLHSGNWRHAAKPLLWDGNAAKRIIDTIYQLFEPEFRKVTFDITLTQTYLETGSKECHTFLSSAINSRSGVVGRLAAI